MAFAVASSAPCMKVATVPLAAVLNRTSSAASYCCLNSHFGCNLRGGLTASRSPVSVGIAGGEGPWRQRQWQRRNGTDGRSRSVQLQAALATETSDVPKVEVGQWTWTFEGKPIKIYFKEYAKNATDHAETILLLPTISDVSTTAEWDAVADSLVKNGRGATYRIVSVDWPGLGLSDRPSISYTADMMEQFLADFVSAEDGPLGPSKGRLPVIVGGGHAGTIAARALSKGLVHARALAAVAPTWAGPLPIVFGRASNMEFRYKLLRDALRSPAVGWATYKYLVSSPKNIKLQYETHVYADANNLTSAVIEDRTALTQREGARYAPAAFLTGLLDPTTSREELLELFAKLDGKVPTLVVATTKSPKRSRAEMEALEGVKGVTKFSRVPGALLPQEEYPGSVTDELLAFLAQ